MPDLTAAQHRMLDKLELGEPVIVGRLKHPQAKTARSLVQHGLAAGSVGGALAITDAGRDALYAGRWDPPASNGATPCPTVKS